MKRAKSAGVPTQSGYEAPENKIGGRYPFLEHAYAQRGVPEMAMSVRMQKHAKKV